MTNLKLKPFLLAVITACTAGSARAARYEVVFGVDEITNYWNVHFDGTDAGNFITDVHNISFTILGENVGPYIYAGHANSDGSFTLGNAQVGKSELYSNFVFSRLDTPSNIWPDFGYFFRSDAVVNPDYIDHTYAHYWDSSLQVTATNFVSSTAPTIQRTDFYVVSANLWYPNVFSPPSYTFIDYGPDASQTSTPNTNTIPEPTTFALLSFGIAGLGLTRRTRAKF